MPSTCQSHDDVVARNIVEVGVIEVHTQLLLVTHSQGTSAAEQGRRHGLGDQTPASRVVKSEYIVTKHLQEDLQYPYTCGTGTSTLCRISHPLEQLSVPPLIHCSSMQSRIFYSCQLCDGEGEDFSIPEQKNVTVKTYTVLNNIYKMLGILMLLETVLKWECYPYNWSERFNKIMKLRYRIINQT